MRVARFLLLAAALSVVDCSRAAGPLAEVECTNTKAAGAVAEQQHADDGTAAVSHYRPSPDKLFVKNELAKLRKTHPELDLETHLRLATKTLHSMSSYKRFMAQQLAKLKETHPELNEKDHYRIATKMWKTRSNGQRTSTVTT